MSARELADKVAIVTGGSRGIGLAIAESLADAGATIAVIGRNGERARISILEVRVRLPPGTLLSDSKLFGLGLVWVWVWVWVWFVN